MEYVGIHLKDKRKRMKRTVKKIIGVLILLSGIAIFFYPDYRNWKNQMEIQRIRAAPQKETQPVHTESDTEMGQNEQKDSMKEKGKTLEQKTTADTEKLFAAMQEYNNRLVIEGQDISDAWDFQRIPDVIADLNPDSDAVGYIELPDIELSLPIYIGATEKNMSRGAVVLTGTSMPIGGEATNSVIAAHRGWKGSPYFRDIDQLSVGSKIYIHNLWTELVYQVTGTEIIASTECSILEIKPRKDMITLFSCYPYMSPGTNYRLVVYCERVEGAEKKAEIQTSSVKDLIEKDLEEKGIATEEVFWETVSDREDFFRVMLPAGCILGIVVGILIYKVKKR